MSCGINRIIYLGFITSRDLFNLPITFLRFLQTANRLGNLGVMLQNVSESHRYSRGIESSFEETYFLRRYGSGIGVGVLQWEHFLYLPFRITEVNSHPSGDIGSSVASGWQST